MLYETPPITTDMVLVGGGHSHLFVLKQFGMRPLPGVRLTLVTRDMHTPYSGMLPGLIAGHYDFDEAHIDLAPLARFAGARVVHGEVTGLDTERQRLVIEGRPELEYDYLSLNIGSRPGQPGTTSTDPAQLAVKPVDRFIRSWQQLEQQLTDSKRKFRLAIVGGGAGGVELALSLQYRAQRLSADLELLLLTDQPGLLPGHNQRVQDIFTDILERRSIEVFYQRRVTGLEQDRLRGDFTDSIEADAIVWVTNASPAPWLATSGLALDEQGFVAVDACLQSLSHPGVFAAGDIAAVRDQRRPKSGVFAVRQGLPLARNLASSVCGKPLKPFRAQSRFLSLISTGDRYAIASRGLWALQGRWCWRLKDRIDRNFMRRFSDLPRMGEDESPSGDLTPMRCAGCGSKVGSGVLEQVLDRISQDYQLPQSEGLGYRDDAASIPVPAGMQLIQTVDQFRSFIDDPYLFGRIAANHALGDMFAMGVDAHSALVHANVVFGSEDKQAQDLYQLMAGVVETLQAQETRLLGGHSAEAAQMSCGLSVNGFARQEDLLLKSGLRPNDLLILTKPLGSGIVFAGEMRGKARGAWIDDALHQMLVSSRDAASCLKRYGTRACTDITGFGLAGHMLEMARASQLAMDIYIDRIPLFSGARELAQQGIGSSLQPQNMRVRHHISDATGLAHDPVYPLLFDPQTAGGLLAGVEPELAQACLHELHGLGYHAAQIVGRVFEKEKSASFLNLVNS